MALFDLIALHNTTGECGSDVNAVGSLTHAAKQQVADYGVLVGADGGEGLECRTTVCNAWLVVGACG